MDKRRTALGFTLVIVSAIAFSIKSILAKLLYGLGVDPLTLLTMRFTLALPLFLGALFFYPSQRPTVKDLGLLVVSGLAGLYLAAILDFYGLVFVDASVERVVIFVYPTIVLLLSAVIFKRRVSRTDIAALALTYAGLLLVLNDAFGVAPRPGFLLGAVLILLSAIIYALSCLLTESLGKRLHPIKISAYAATTATAAYLVTWGARGAHLPEGKSAWTLLAILAVVSTFVPVVSFVAGIKLIGATRASVASSIGPVSTAILGFFLLDERLDGLQIFGILLVLVGVSMLSLFRGRDEGPR